MPNKLSNWVPESFDDLFAESASNDSDDISKKTTGLGPLGEKLKQNNNSFSKPEGKHFYPETVIKNNRHSAQKN